MKSLFALVLTAVAAQAGTFYVSPTGSDENPGTREAPWQTLAKANGSLAPGDVAVFLPGTYTGTISPEQSGVAYRAESPGAARLETAERTWLISLNGLEQVDISGFHLDGGGSGGWISATDSRGITIRDCVMRRARLTTQFRRCSQVKLLDSVFSMDLVSGNMVQLVECTEALVEGNSFARVGHSPLQITTCQNIVVRGNCFRNDWGRNYEFWATGRILVEGNIITEARDSGHSADSRAKNLYSEGIFRLNRVFGNLHTPLNSGSYMPMGANPTSHFREPFRLVDSRIYHNVFADNLGYGWEIGGINISANVWQNNIFHRNDWAGGQVQFFRGDGISLDNRIVANLFRGDEPGGRVLRHGSEFWTVEEANRRTRAYQDFWSEFKDNVDAEPGFVDPANRDYRLGPDSEAADAGHPLTLALGSGSGSILPVADGRFFFDGFGIEGEQGDWIAVGEGGNLARIERIERRFYLPALLHLDREVSWTNGMPVSLPWVGEAPDLGAFERDGTHPSRIVALVGPARPAPGETVLFRLDPLGKQPETLRWDFADGTVSTDPSPTHAFAEPGNYGVTVRATFADGQRGIDVAFVQVAEPTDPAAPLVEGDFETATRDAVWGYQFKFYRGHQTGYAQVARPDGEGRCMRLFYDAKKANRTAAQVAPGAWDLDRYPVIRFAYRIPPGVPVAFVVEPFTAPGVPRGFVLAGSPAQNIGSYTDLNAYPLTDDGQWHEAVMDARRVRDAHPDLRYLRMAMFHLNWREDQGQEFWLDDFRILPEPAAD